MAAIASKLPQSKDGKRHNSGLGEVDSEALRREVFQLNKDHNPSCVYSATAVEGFHANYQRLKTAHEAGQSHVAFAMA